MAKPKKVVDQEAAFAIRAFYLRLFRLGVAAVLVLLLGIGSTLLVNRICPTHVPFTSPSAVKVRSTPLKHAAKFPVVIVRDVRGLQKE